jgi:hypothetical protein
MRSRLESSTKLNLSAKIVRGLFYGCLVVVLLYTVSWFVALITLSKSIDNKYADHEIDILSADSGYKYSIRFKNSSPTGFPFKIALKFNDLVEEGAGSIVDYKSPIVIGYDLLRSSLFFSFSGEAQAIYKPIQSGFGVRIFRDNHVASVLLPLSLKLFKTLREGQNIFQLVNFVKALENRSEKVVILDLTDDSKLYEADYENLNVAFMKPKFYLSIEDLLQNIPGKIDISYASKVKYIKPNTRLVPENLSQTYMMPIKLDGTCKISIITKSQNISNLSDALDLYFAYTPNDSAEYKIHPMLLYKSSAQNDNREVSAQFSSNFMFSSGFFERLFNSLEYITDNLRDKLDHRTLEAMKYLVINKDLLSLKHLEKGEYEVALDFDLSTRLNQTHLNLVDFSLLSLGDRTGVRISGKSEIHQNSDRSYWMSEGVGLLYNSNVILDSLLPLIYSLKTRFDQHGTETSINLGNLEHDEEAKDLYVDAAKYFLRSISDHPTSTSNEMSFEYKIDSRELNKAKIGNSSIDKFVSMYYLALYQSLSDRLKGKNTLDLIKKFIPNTDQNQEKFIKQILKDAIPKNQESLKIDKDTWKKLVK